jgi:hypothetical protein
MNAETFFSGSIPELRGLSGLPVGLLAGWLATAVARLGLPLGAMGHLAIHLLTGGRWGVTLRPALRTRAMALPIGLLALAPLLFALPALFPWTAPAETLPEIVQEKLAWLDPRFLVLRSGICAVIWLALAVPLVRRTRPDAPARGATLPVCALIALALSVSVSVSVSVFDIDWIMSLEPEFYSTIHPLIAICAMLLGAVSAGLAWTAACPHQSRASADQRESIANLTFGFLLHWAYMQYMQWLIVWAADLPHEISWHLTRGRDGWGAVLFAVVSLPISASIAPGWRQAKRHASRAIAIAGLVILTYVVDTCWGIMPPLVGPGWILAPVVVLGVLGTSAIATDAWRKERAHA